MSLVTQGFGTGFNLTDLGTELIEAILENDEVVGVIINEIIEGEVIAPI